MTPKKLILAIGTLITLGSQAVLADYYEVGRHDNRGRAPIVRPNPPRYGEPGYGRPYPGPVRPGYPTYPPPIYRPLPPPSYPGYPSYPGMRPESWTV